jgi:hypothetical protein
MADDHAADSGGLESREPTVEELCDLCRELNQRGARYLVVGGFAIRAAGYIRRTMDVDLLVDTGLLNGMKRLPGFEALSEASEWLRWDRRYCCHGWPGDGG